MLRRIPYDLNNNVSSVSVFVCLTISNVFVMFVVDVV
jgi:hypothetical protein